MYGSSSAQLNGGLIKAALANGPIEVDVVEESKRRAAYYCVAEHVRSGQVIGVGTGSTAAYLVYALAEKYKSGQLTNINCVPTSFQSRHLILDYGLPLSDLERTPDIDIGIDGADEVDAHLNAIKGGGGCLTQEKIVQSCAKRFMIIADFRKRSQKFGDRFARLPLEVVPNSYMPIKRRIESQHGGTCHLRMAVRKAGPVISDNSNLIVDWEFPKEKDFDWHQLNVQLKMMPGKGELV